MQARPCPVFGQLVHRWGRPLCLRPGTAPQALQTPPHGGRPALRVIHPAPEALPSGSDMSPPVRGSVGFQPTRQTCCHAHNMASADFWQFRRTSLYVLPKRKFILEGLSARPPRIKTTAFLPVPATFTVQASDGIGLRFVQQTHPTCFCLRCDSYTSGQDFASSFLQIPPRGGLPCLQLVVGAVTPHSGLSPLSCRPCRAHCKEQESSKESSGVRVQ